MESLARLIIILFACHFVAGLCFGGLFALYANHLNFYVKILLTAVMPLFTADITKFPFNVVLTIGAIIPIATYWLFYAN